MNTYFAVSLDLYNKKEYIIYSIGGKETNNLYRKWKQRIDRDEEKYTIGSEDIAQLRHELKELTDINRKSSNQRKRNEYDDLERFDKAYFDALNISDRKLYELFDALTAEKK